jgi:hypothetical protein
VIAVRGMFTTSCSFIFATKCMYRLKVKVNMKVKVKSGEALMALGV